jgi:hypothetical protein
LFRLRLVQAASESQQAPNALSPHEHATHCAASRAKADGRLRSGRTGDPARSAEHRLNDQIVTWTGELKDDWVKKAKPHTIGVMEFDGLLFDGWGNVLGG